jgi:hypothetical protein
MPPVAVLGLIGDETSAQGLTLASDDSMSAGRCPRGGALTREPESRPIFRPIRLTRRTEGPTDHQNNSLDRCGLG